MRVLLVLGDDLPVSEVALDGAADDQTRHGFLGS
jgi:hypothetical protein